MQAIDQTQLIPLIKKLMEAKGISNAKLGKKMNYSRAYIGEILNSDEMAFIDAKIKMLKELGVNAEYKKEVKIFIK